MSASSPSGTNDVSSSISPTSNGSITTTSPSISPQDPVKKNSGSGLSPVLAATASRPVVGPPRPTTANVAPVLPPKPPKSPKAATPSVTAATTSGGSRPPSATSNVEPETCTHKISEMDSLPHTSQPLKVTLPTLPPSSEQPSEVPKQLEGENAPEDSAPHPQSALAKARAKTPPVKIPTSATPSPSHSKTPPASVPSSTSPSKSPPVSTTLPAKPVSTSVPTQPTVNEADSDKDRALRLASKMSPPLMSPKPAVKQPRKRPAPTVKSPPQPTRGSTRTRKAVTQFQSPNPEIQQIMKNIRKQEIESTQMKKKEPDEANPAIFFKGEHLAVRNAEGGYYVCQTMQNIYKTSRKIKIQWLSESLENNPNKDVYSPEYYDKTEFETILSSVELDKLDKKRLRLPKSEHVRIQKILQRAVDKEEGKLNEEDMKVSEDNPEGLDISLYKDEDQLKKIERKRKREARKNKIEDDGKSSAPKTKKPKSSQKKSLSKRKKATKKEAVKKTASISTKKPLPTLSGYVVGRRGRSAKLQLESEEEKTLEVTMSDKNSSSHDGDKAMSYHSDETRPLNKNDARTSPTIAPSVGRGKKVEALVAKIATEKKAEVEQQRQHQNVKRNHDDGRLYNDKSDDDDDQEEEEVIPMPKKRAAMMLKEKSTSSETLNTTTTKNSEVKKRGRPKK